MELKEIRKEISEIDEHIINLINQRFNLIPDLIKAKKCRNIQAFQPARENQMQKRYWELSINYRLNPEVIRQIFDLIITEMREIQEKRLVINE